MASLVYKWRLGNCIYGYLTTATSGSPYIDKTGSTTDSDESAISAIVKEYSESEYKSQYESLCEIISADSDVSSVVMLDYKYYYNIDETSCGYNLSNSTYYKGDQGKQGVGIQYIDTIQNSGSTIIRFYLTDGTSYDAVIRNGSDGTNGTSGTDGSDGQNRNIIMELDYTQANIDSIRDSILSSVTEAMNEQWDSSQNALDDFRNLLGTLTGNVSNAVTWIDESGASIGAYTEYIDTVNSTLTEMGQYMNALSGVMGEYATRIDAVSSTTTEYKRTVDMANSLLTTSMSYYNEIEGILNKYTSQYDAVANRYENIVAEMTGNGTISLSEIYQTSNEIGLFVSSSGDSTNPITAAIIATINDDSSEISLSATKIKLLGETVASQLTTVTLDINGGASHFDSDGSGWIANKGIQWDTEGNLAITGQLTIGEIIDGLGSNNVTFGKGSSAPTIFASDGSGSLANGNIYWDIYGNLTIKEDVTIEGSLTVDEILDSAKNSIISFGGENTNAVTYFYPDGSGSLAGGAISWDTDGSIKIAGDLTVGGSIIQEVIDSLDENDVALCSGYTRFDGTNGSGYLAGGLISWEVTNGNVSMTIKGDVTIEGGDSIVEDNLDSIIAALNVRDISVGSGSTKFNVDGSGWLANKNYSWDENGNTQIFNSAITWTNSTSGVSFNIQSGYIGGFSISGNQLVSNDSSAYQVSLSPTYLLFRDSTGSTPSSLLSLGNYASFAVGGIRSFFTLSTTESSINNIKCGLMLRVSGATLASSGTDDVYRGNNAIMISNGCIAGLRLKLRRIYENTILTNYDNVVIVYKSGIIITLPPSPDDGHVILIKAATSGGYTISRGNDNHDIYGPGVSWSIPDYVQTILIFDKTESRWHSSYATTANE